MLEIHPYQNSNQAAVTNLLETVWQGEISYVSRISRFNFAAFVALEQAVVIGYASLFTNPNHPERDYIGIHIHPTYQRQGIGSKLFTALEPFFRQHRKIQTITPFASSQLFLRQHGFDELMKTYSPILEIQKTIPIEYQLPNGFQLETMSNTQFTQLEIAQLHASIYSEQHIWNPTTPFDDQTALKTFMDDAVAEAMFLITHQGKAIALLSLRGEAPELELAWFGVLNAHAAHRTMLTRVLLNAAIEYAQKHKITHILAELDSLIPEAALALELLPFEPCTPWVTMLKNP